MANGDVDRNASKPADGQLDFSGGMDWISDAAKMAANKVRIAENVDVRSGNAVKSKGQQPAAELEIGARYYDRFTSVDLQNSKWVGFATGDGTVAINSDNELVITGVTSGHAWDGVGVVAQEQTPKATLGYIEFELTTPTTTDSNSRFRIGLSADKAALDTDSGLEIEFDENLDIIRREATSETDTTVDWVAATKYRVRIEKKDTGWKGYIVDLTNAATTAVSLFDTSYTGTADNFIEFQAYGSAWKLDNVVVQDGFGSVGARAASQGIYRYYRETATNETVVGAYGSLYKYDTSSGYTLIKAGFNVDNKFKFRIFNDELYIVNGSDRPQIYNSLNIQDISAAPIAEGIEVHLQSLFMYKGNSLFRNTPGNTRTWDALEPLVDVDAWKGDIIKGLLKLGSNLYVIKSASVWELVGTRNSNFVLRRVLGSRGCIAEHSIATNGHVAYWRGPEGVYEFNGTITKLVSYDIHPAFDDKAKSEFLGTLRSAAKDSVGVIHDFKYRLAVVQYGEEDLGYNNYEYVYDMVADNGRGAWTTRTNRNVCMYSVWDGDNDENRLYYVPSDTSNDLFLAEVDQGNYRNKYDNVTIVKASDVDFPGRVLSRKYTAASSTRPFLDKKWQDLIVTYEPLAKIDLGFTTYTKYNTQGSTRTFTTTNSVNKKVMDGTAANALSYDGATDIYTDIYVEEKTDTKSIRLDSQSNKNQGTELWWEIKQTATGSGLLANAGNFQPFSIKKVICRFTEANH